MQKWDEEGQDDKFNEMFMEEWGKQWVQEQPGPVDVIPFEPKNEYMDKDGTLKLAK